MSGATDIEFSDREGVLKETRKESCDKGVTVTEEGDKKELEHGEKMEEPIEYNAHNNEGDDEEEASGVDKTNKASSSLAKKIYQTLVKQILPGVSACLTKQVSSAQQWVSC